MKIGPIGEQTSRALSLLDPGGDKYEYSEIYDNNNNNNNNASYNNNNNNNNDKCS